MHQDEDFQQDMVRLRLERVIEDIKADPKRYDKCAAARNSNRKLVLPLRCICP